VASVSVCVGELNHVGEFNHVSSERNHAFGEFNHVLVDLITRLVR
jgi:hypothetical protein